MQLKSPEPCKKWHFQKPPGLLAVRMVPSGARPCTAGGQILTAGPGHLQVAEQDGENKCWKKSASPSGNTHETVFFLLV